MCAAKGGSLARTGSKAKNAEKRVVFPYGKRDAFVPFGILYRHVSGCTPNSRSGRPLPGAILLIGGIGGYVLTAIITFIVATALTVICIKRRNK